MRIFNTLLAVCLLVISVIPVHAEILGGFILTPQNPGPYETTTITLNSYDFDVDSSDISWTVNGKTVRSGPGAKQLTLTTGAVGTLTTVSARARLPNGQVFQAAMTLTPASVDIIWESRESYVPPFYEGRSLPGEGAIVHFTALPYMSSNGKPLTPGDISYAWYKNDQFIDSASGRGKQSADIPLEYLTDVTSIKVSARSGDGTVATKSIDIYPHEVVPLFYLYDAALGLDSSQAISKRFETTKEFTLRLVPYFFSLNNGLSRKASFSWTLDGVPITTKDNTTVTLKPKEDSFGSRVLGVALENSSRVLQNIDTRLNIVFDTRQ